MPKKRIPGSRKNNKGKNKALIKDSQEITDIAKKIKEIFKKKNIQKLAELSGFIQRNRKLDAYIFFYH